MAVHRFLALICFIHSAQSLSTMSSSRRRWLIKSTVAGIITGAAIPSHSIAAAVDTTSTGTAFTTAAVGQEEYTNAITASRDTNISPKEAYDTILNKIPVSVVKNSGGRALDLGAGAGLSTQLLYEKGYHTIDAVDWSGDAWNTYVESSPETVTFYEMADAPFFKLHAERRLEKYDVICYNFAVNPEKAVRVAKGLLAPKGILLAPVNDRADYWYKQTYWIVDAAGAITYKSAQEVGAWSVQFQPDVTQDTCTGIWCGGFNGFKQQ